MTHDIEVAIDLLETARSKIRQLIEQAGEYEDPHRVHAQVDLGHAERQVQCAISFVNRLLVNGHKPWDEVTA